MNPFRLFRNRTARPPHSSTTTTRRKFSLGIRRALRKIFSSQRKEVNQMQTPNSEAHEEQLNQMNQMENPKSEEQIETFNRLYDIFQSLRYDYALLLYIQSSHSHVYLKLKPLDEEYSKLQENFRSAHTEDNANSIIQNTQGFIRRLLVGDLETARNALLENSSVNENIQQLFMGKQFPFGRDIYESVLLSLTNEAHTEDTEKLRRRLDESKKLHDILSDEMHKKHELASLNKEATEAINRYSHIIAEKSNLKSMQKNGIFFFIDFFMQYCKEIPELLKKLNQKITGVKNSLILRERLEDRNKALESQSEARVGDSTSDRSLDDLSSDMRVDDLTSDRSVDNTPSDRSVDNLTSNMRVDDLSSDMSKADTPSDMNKRESPSYYSDWNPFNRMFRSNPSSTGIFDAWESFGSGEKTSIEKLQKDYKTLLYLKFTIDENADSFVQELIKLKDADQTYIEAKILEVKSRFSEDIQPMLDSDSPTQFDIRVFTRVVSYFGEKLRTLANRLDERAKEFRGRLNSNFLETMRTHKRTDDKFPSFLRGLKGKIEIAQKYLSNVYKTTLSSENRSHVENNMRMCLDDLILNFGNVNKLLKELKLEYASSNGGKRRHRRTKKPYSSRSFKKHRRIPRRRFKMKGG